MTHSSRHYSELANPLTDWWPKSLFEIGLVAKALRYDPLKGLSRVSELPTMKRFELLAMEKMPLAPTAQHVQIAVTLLSMMHGSLSIRNPLLASGSVLVNGAIEAALDAPIGEEDAAAEPVAGSCCLPIIGITSLAKTTVWTHTMRMLGPQVRRFRGTEASGILEATQLVYLKVAMSHDGTRGGFVTNMLLAIDKALGTRCSIDIPRKFAGIERQVGAIIALLHSYYLGLLIIEEAQERTLVSAWQSDDMQLLILSICNAGLPCVFVGNPMAYTWLPDFAQDAARFARLTCGHLHPIGAMAPENWKEALEEPIDPNGPQTPQQEAAVDWKIVSAGVMRYRVMLVKDENLCSLKLLDCSGGISGLALSLWCDAQTDALIRGHQKVTEDDIQRAYDKEGFKTVKDLARGFATRDPLLLSGYSDVPALDYARAWGKDDALLALQSAVIPAKTPRKEARRPRSSKGSGERAFKATQSRQAARGRKAAQVRASLPADSLRIQGLAAYHLQSFEKMRQASAEAAQHASGSRS